MKSFLFCLLFPVTLLTAHCAQAAELSASDYAVCDGLAELAYQSAVLDGDGLPDGAWSKAQSDCEEWSGARESLNDLVAIDGEAWLPVCLFAGGCAQ